MSLRPRSKLFPHQRFGAERIVAHPDNQLMLLLEPGYGKTATTLTALRDLGAWPALVVAPARIAKRTWAQEAAAWEHLRNVQVTGITGPPERRRRLLGEDSHVEVVSYENLFWLSEEVSLNRRYAAIVFDELSKMKSAGTKRFTRLRAPKSGCMGIPVRVGLTGTPVGNHLLDLWGETFMVAGAKALGPTFTDFREHYFEPTDYMQRVWALKGKETGDLALAARLEKEIHLRVKPWAFVTEASAAVAIPPVVVNPIAIDLPASVARMHEELERELFTTLPSGDELEALSKSSVAMKLRQLASGAVFKDQFSEKWEEVHAEKLDALEDLLDELQGAPLLCFYWFTHERARLLKRFGKRARLIETPADEDAWNRGEVELGLAHPQSAAFGLNLQLGGHNVCWFALPFSWELFKQGNGRLARPGQLAARVNAHVLTCGQLDARVRLLLEEKARVEGALYASLLAA